MKIGVTERGDAGVHIKEVIRELPKYDAAILITKDPTVVSDHLDEISGIMGERFIVHSTITGYGGTALEPGAPAVDLAIAGYKSISSSIGDRSVLRIDPIIPTDKGLALAISVLENADGRVRISFFDAYQHALKRMTPRMREKIYEVYGGQFHAPIEVRLKALESINKANGAIVSVCGEPGIPCTGCVSKIDLLSMGLPTDSTGKSGQRASCHCLAEKTEMLSHKGQCKHGCLYCYWK